MSVADGHGQRVYAGHLDKARRLGRIGQGGSFAPFNRCVVHFADRPNLTFDRDSVRVRERHDFLHSGDVFIEWTGRVVEHDRGVTRRKAKLDGRGGVSVIQVQGGRDAIFRGERATYPPQGVG